MNKKIEDAILISNRVQRNFDRTKSIDPRDLETMIYACKNAPSKQNETHYKVLVIKNEKLIYKIYRNTPHFTLYTDSNDLDWSGRSLDEKLNITNSQVWAKVLFAFCDDWDQSRSRAGVHKIVEERKNVDPSTIIEKEKQKNYSIGIASGMVALSATMLGYRTGYCSAFHQTDIEARDGKHGYNFGMEKIMKELKDLKLLLGVGHDNLSANRREHPEVKNKEVGKYSNGNPDENWMFPSFDKKIELKIIE